jgi:hypothetical protein
MLAFSDILGYFAVARVVAVPDLRVRTTLWLSVEKGLDAEM